MQRRESPWPEPANTCLAYNAGETDLRMFGAATVVGSLVEGDLVQYKRVLSVQTPAVGDEGRFVVCAEPILAGRVGRVWVSGICPVWLVNETGADALSADVTDAQDYLTAKSGGSAAVLWEDVFEEAAEHLALIRIGDLKAQVAWFEIQSVEDDYLVCWMLDAAGAPIETNVNVAKPHMLRKKPFDGETRNSVTYDYTDSQTRTASKVGEDDITERVTPSFQVGDKIVAEAGVFGGTLCDDAPDWLMRSDRVWAESDE